MKQFSWIIFVFIAICSVHITMANLQQWNSSAEYIPAPTLFRSVFAGRPALGYPKDSVYTQEEESEKENLNLLEEASEENNVEDESEGSDEDGKSNESRIKKNASSSEESDEDDSDEDDSDEDDSDEDDEKSSSESKNTKPSRWRPTRYGSSFRIQAVGRPISYDKYYDGSRKLDTPKY